MLRSYLRTAFRSLTREKGYTLLNILGLAIGLAGCILLFAHVRADYLWDGFHEKSEHIYRLNQIQTFGGVEPQHVAYSAPPIAPVMVDEVPEIIDAARFMEGSSQLLGVPGSDFQYEPGSAYADPSFLTIFSYPLLYGDRETMLSDPNAIVINREIAQKYFGVDNPIGMSLRFRGERDVTVTGVLDDFPAGTHLSFRFLLPMESAYRDNPQLKNARDSWGYNTLATYVLLAEKVAYTALNDKLHEFFSAHRSMDRVEYYLQPLPDLHLRSGFVKFETNDGATSTQNVYTMLTIGTFLLLLAIINYLNLATGRAVRRAREVGLRKVVGARRSQLVVQFMGESALVTFFSMIVAIFLVYLFRSSFENLSGREIVFDLLSGKFEIGFVLGLTLLVALLTGVYPSFVLSSFRPVTVLKGRIDSHSKGAWMRRALVVFQFTTTIVLVISTAAVYRQVDYLRKKDVGFDQHNVMILPLREEAMRERGEGLRNRLLTVPGIEAASLSSRMPAWGGGQTSVTPEGMDSPWLVSYYLTDPHHADVLNLPIVQGRFFSEAFPADVLEEKVVTTGALIFNETAVRKLGWENPIGKQVQIWDRSVPVIGVVRDFHYNSFRGEIEPLMFLCRPNGEFLSLRYNNSDVTEQLDLVKQVWMEEMNDIPFVYYFLDERFDRIFRADARFGNILRLFALLTIFIASLGLLGLTSYATQRRTREIGVRKVLGASVGQILVLVTREFALLVLVASLIAWPVAWYVMRDWLEQFAYRPAFGWWLFPAAAGAALLLAMLTISFLAWRAANTNPAKVLRHE